MAALMTRRAFTCVAGGGTAALVFGQARAAGWTGVATYPIAIAMYQAQYVAAAKGFFKDAGIDCKLLQGGSGVKAREMVAAGQADIGIGDITHPMQLTNHGRSAQVLMPADTRNNAVVFVIRKDLADQGITDLNAFAAWTRPDGRKPILGVSSLGGTTHVWASYYLELMGLDEKVTWIGAGDVDTMLGSIKTKQIDALAAAPSLLRDAVAHNWGAPLFNGSSEANWNKYIGGKVPATAHFTLQATIDQDKPKMQAYVTALWRATQWIKSQTPEQILTTIEPYVGSTSHDSNVFEVKLMKDVTDYDGIIDQASYERGAKVWFRDMTGITPIPLAKMFTPDFVVAAKKAFPA
jgi:NitT/TauT family transport system substrate-binding protein